MSVLGDNIKRMRERCGFSQQELADMCFVTQQAVNKWECGISVPQSDRIEDIARCLDVSVDALFYNDYDRSYEVPIDITDQLQAIITGLKEKSRVSGLDYAESMELYLTERMLNDKGGRYIRHRLYTDYEYNLYKSIKHIYPDYSLDDFEDIMKGASEYKLSKLKDLLMSSGSGEDFCT